MKSKPYYLEVGTETRVFESAWRTGHALMLKGPTGVGKTRLVEHMAARLDRPLITVSCHEDLNSADLLGRHLLKGGSTEWIDGPVTRAVREGAICYLDEVVEARADTTVLIHALTDHRRELYLDRLGETLSAPSQFMLVVSYNPGYQSVLKDLKPSTRQRMVALELTFPPPEVEAEVVVKESQVERDIAVELVKLATAIRQLDAPGLPEVSSTRSIIAAGDLISSGLSPREAILSGMILPLCDDQSLVESLEELVKAYFAD